MKYLSLILLCLVITSCAKQSFTKRKFSKGIYIEKRTHLALKKKDKPKPEKTLSQNDEIEPNEDEIHSILKPSQKEDLILNEKDKLKKIEKSEIAASSNEELNKLTQSLKRTKETQKKPSKGLTSLILGAIALLLLAALSYLIAITILMGVGHLFLIIIIPLLTLTLSAIILGHLSRNEDTNNNYSLIGIILGYISLAIIAAFLIWFTIIFF